MRKNSTNRFARVTVDLTEQGHNRLERLEGLVAKSKADILRDALRLYEWAVQNYAEGGHFYTVDKNGNSERMFLLGVDTANVERSVPQVESSRRR